MYLGEDFKHFESITNRQFVQDFSKIARPLTRLTRKDVKFVWDVKYKAIIRELNQRLTTTPILIVRNSNE